MRVDCGDERAEGVKDKTGPTTRGYVTTSMAFISAFSATATNHSTQLSMLAMVRTARLPTQLQRATCQWIFMDANRTFASLATKFNQKDAGDDGIFILRYIYVCSIYSHLWLDLVVETFTVALIEKYSARRNA